MHYAHKAQIAQFSLHCKQSGLYSTGQTFYISKFSTFISKFSTWTEETSWTIELQGLYREHQQDHRITGTREPLGPQNYRDQRTNRIIELQGLENHQDQRITGAYRYEVEPYNYRNRDMKQNYRITGTRDMKQDHRITGTRDMKQNHRITGTEI